MNPLEPVIILDSDDIEVTAEKIFYKFELMQSCTIRGYIVVKKEVLSRGEEVLKHLENLDSVEYTCKKDAVGSGYRRKRVKLLNSIGGYVAQKIFKYKKQHMGNDLVVTIWRYQ